MARGRHIRVKPAHLFRIRLAYMAFMFFIVGFVIAAAVKHAILAGFAALAVAGVVTVLMHRYVMRLFGP